MHKRKKTHSHLYVHAIFFSLKGDKKNSINTHITACRHTHTCASSLNRPYAAYCQHEHVTKRTLWLQPHQQSDWMCKKGKKNEFFFLSASWFSSGIRGCSAKVHLSHCITRRIWFCPCKWSRQSQRRHVSEKVTVCSENCQKMREREMKMQIGVLH